MTMMMLVITSNNVVTIGAQLRYQVGRYFTINRRLPFVTAIVPGLIRTRRL